MVAIYFYSFFSWILESSGSRHVLNANIFRIRYFYAETKSYCSIENDYKPIPTNIQKKIYHILHLSPKD